nr:dimethyl sulfoxide reductase anchor subunit family protein [uncultured Moellerella sp.]
MGMGWHEWPLIVFTVLGQCVVGAFIIMALSLISGHADKAQKYRVQMNMFFLWVLMGVAFIASVMHLGSPLRAFNSLNRIGESALSNEIAAGSLFFAVGGFYWLLAALKKMPDALGKLWLIITIILSLVFVFAMTRVYQIDTVPTWYNNYTNVNFVLTALIGGPLLAYLLLRQAGVSACAMRLLPIINGLAVLASSISLTMQGIDLVSINSSVQQAATLIPELGAVIGWRFSLLALGLIIWVIPMLKGRLPSVALLFISFILMVAGEMLGRSIFYGLHMTVGMAVAG